MNMWSSRALRPKVFRSQGWLLLTLVLGCLGTAQESPGCSIRRNVGKHVTPSNAGEQLTNPCNCALKPTATQNLLHKVLAAHTTPKKIKHPASGHVSPSSLPHNAVAAHHLVHKSSKPVHNEAAEKGEKPDKDDLVTAAAGSHCICKPSVVHPAVVPPVTLPQETIPEPGTLISATVLGLAGFLVRKRTVGR